MRILLACEHSNTVSSAFRARGHDVLSCDLLPNDNPDVRHYQGDVFDLVDENFDIVIAHPPCTALAVSGNRHYAGTEAREKALLFFARMLIWPCEKVCVENPVGVVSSQIMPPSQYVQPWMFGDAAEKKTGLWLFGLPPLIPTNVVKVPPPVVFPSGKSMSQWYYQTSLLPQKERAKSRSKTFPGLASAMAQQWG